MTDGRRAQGAASEVRLRRGARRSREPGVREWSRTPGRHQLTVTENERQPDEVPSAYFTENQK